MATAESGVFHTMTQVFVICSAGQGRGARAILHLGTGSISEIFITRSAPDDIEKKRK